MTQPSPLPPIVAVEGILDETAPANSVGHRHHLVLRTSIRATQRGYGVYVCHTPRCPERRELPRHFEGAVRRNAKTGYPEMMPRVQYGPGKTLLPHNWLTGG